MRRIGMLLLPALAVLAILPNSAAAQTGDGARILREVRAGDRSCGDVSNAGFQAVGEYVMGRHLGSRRSHEAMDELMKTMMGERAERRMHVYLGRRATRCGGGPAPAELGGMMGAMRGLWGSASMMGGPGAMSASGNGPGSMMGRTGGVASRDDGWSVGETLLAFLIGALAGLTLVMLWRRSRGPGDEEATAAELLARRYARGEIDDREYERRRHAIGGVT